MSEGALPPADRGGAPQASPHDGRERFLLMRFAKASFGASRGIALGRGGRSEWLPMIAGGVPRRPNR